MILTSQVTFVLMAPLVLAWIWARRERWAWSGFALGLLMSVKPFLLLLVPYLLLKRRWTALAACGSALLLCFTLGLLIFGVGNHQSWYQRLGIAGSWAWLPMNASLLGMISRTFCESPYFTEAASWTAGEIQFAFFGLGGVIALISLASAGLDRGPGEVDRSFALLLVASIVLCPLGWNYYFWLPLGPVLGVVLEWKRRAARHGQTIHVGRIKFWIVCAGMFWPVQLNQLGQQSVWATALIANLYFWTALVVWLILLARSWSTGSPRTAMRFAV
jgi:hypothetical protein